MPRIPMGDFGQRVAQVGPTPTAQVHNQVGNAVQRLAGTGLQVADQAMTDIERQTRLQKEQDDALARSNAGDGLLDYELKSREAAQSIKIRMENGTLSYADAPGELDRALSGIKPPEFGPGQSLIAKQYARGVERHRFQAGAAVNLFVEGAKRAELRTNFDAAIDKVGKLAMLPGSTLDSSFAQLDAVAQSGRGAFVSEAELARTIQNKKDDIRYRRAQDDLVQARRDPVALGAYKTRLESGDLSNTLDPDKRIALLREADTLQVQSQNQAQLTADKREKQAERAITRTTKQIEGGTPLSADGWIALREQVKDTPYAQEFNTLVEQERTTQKVLRMPIAEQETWVQQRETQLMQNGGTDIDRANLQRIKATVDANKKQLQEAPLQASQRLFGRPVVPLDPNDLLQPGGAERASAVFAERSTTLAAMRKQFGPLVGSKPLLPQESALLVKALDQAGPSQATQLFATLRAAVDDEDTYRAVMQQVAPDSPVKARAGVLAALDRQMVTESRTFGADVRTSSAKVAETMLAGEQILNRSKGQQASDGRPQTAFVPPRQAFADEFASEAGDLYRGRPGVQEADLQAALAYYVGKAAETGRMHNGAGDIDSGLVKQAMAATLGSIVNFNGHGKVKAPLGMDAGEMQSRLRERFNEAVKIQGLSADTVAAFGFYGVTNYRRDGQYMLTLGGAPVLGRNGSPVILDLEPPPVAGTRYRPAERSIPR